MNTYKVENSRFADLDVDTSQLGTTTNIENLNETVNQLSQEQKPGNNIIVLAKRDNVTHNYFHYFELYWDARDCLSSIIIRMPKTDVDNTKYWINYTGDIVLYMGPKNPDQQVTTDENNKASTTSYWDLQGQTPIFQGEVTRIKETNKDNGIENKEEKEKKIDFEAPLKGEIIKEFAKDSLVFSNTLQGDN